MASKAIPSHLRPQGAAANGSNGPTPAEKRHHGKTQSHVVSKRARQVPPVPSSLDRAFQDAPRRNQIWLQHPTMKTLENIAMLTARTLSLIQSGHRHLTVPPPPPPRLETRASAFFQIFLLQAARDPHVTLPNYNFTFAQSHLVGHLFIHHLAPLHCSFLLPHFPVTAAPFFTRCRSFSLLRPWTCGSLLRIPPNTITTIR